MTHDEIMALDADGLRLAIAEAKGFIPYPANRCPVCGWPYREDGLCKPDVCSMVYRDGEGRPVRADENYPDWPRDIAAAWELVEGIVTHSHWHVEITSDNPRWICSIISYIKGEQYLGRGDTAPLAIARAWLLWKERQP